MTGKTKKTAVTKSTDPKNKEYAKALAVATLRPSVNAAAVIDEYGKPFGEQDIDALIESLVASITKLNGGDMQQCEGLLLGQAYALQSIFMNLSRRAIKQDYMKNYEIFLRLALKAQNQCRMTLETLATIKNPPVVFAKQANIANGPQQVNNGEASLAPAREEKTIQSNELLEVQHEKRLDAGTPGTAGNIDTAMATMEKIDRPQDTGRKGKISQ